MTKRQTIDGLGEIFADRRASRQSERETTIRAGATPPPSRLVSRAPRPSRCEAWFHHGLLRPISAKV